MKRDLAGRALPVQTFYSINWTEVSLVFATPDAVSPRLTKIPMGVHLTWIVNGFDG
jgi:hypothetical protein